MRERVGGGAARREFKGQKRNSDSMMLCEFLFASLRSQQFGPNFTTSYIMRMIVCKMQQTV